MNKSSKLDVCQIVLCKQASLFAVGVYQMCERVAQFYVIQSGSIKFILNIFREKEKLE